MHVWVRRALSAGAACIWLLRQKCDGRVIVGVTDAGTACRWFVHKRVMGGLVFHLV